MSLVRKNKFANFKYSVEKSFEAGIVLTGKDVKAIRANEFEIRDSFLKLENGELFVWNIIFPEATEKINKRKLLLHKNELTKIEAMFKNKKNHGFVLNVRYNDKNLIKFDIGIGTIKKVYEKKSSEKRSTEKRILEKDLKKGFI
jgi:SsrA-binding protein